MLCLFQHLLWSSLTITFQSLVVNTWPEKTAHHPTPWRQRCAKNLAPSAISLKPPWSVLLSLACEFLSIYDRNLGYGKSSRIGKINSRHCTNKWPLANYSLLESRFPDRDRGWVDPSGVANSQCHLQSPTRGHSPIAHHKNVPQHPRLVYSNSGFSRCCCCLDNPYPTEDCAEAVRYELPGLCR